MFRSTALILTFACCCASSVLAAEPQDATCTIAAWNIKRHEDGDAMRTSEIARGIKLLDAEVIILTEVRPHSMLQPLIQELASLGVTYDEVMPTTGQHILGIALLTKPGVAVTNVELLAGTDLDDSNQYRKALAADVRVGKFDLKIIGVHLKSGRGDDSREDRSEQAAKIAQHIATMTAGAEKDILVCGDYNMIPPTEEAEEDEVNFDAMNPGNYLRFLSSDFLRQGSHIQGNGQIGNLLDGYAIARDHTREFVGGSLQLVPLYIALGKTRVQYVRDVSDHLPVVARFDVLADDDD